jgi:hypothetical protein
MVKFGKKEHLVSLQKEGHLHCKTLKHFANCEENEARGDFFESVVESHYMENVKVYIKPVKKAEEEYKWFKAETFLLKKYFKEPLGNVFCMSRLKVNMDCDPYTYSFDERFKKFGTHFLLITNQPVFIERLKNGLKEIGCDFHGHEVQYLDLKRYTGKKTAFQKDHFYSWQEEYRIFFDTTEIIDRDFYIGSLEDISEIQEIEKVPKLLVKRSHEYI